MTSVEAVPGEAIPSPEDMPFQAQCDEDGPGEDPDQSHARPPCWTDWSALGAGIGSRIDVHIGSRIHAGMRRRQGSMICKAAPDLLTRAAGGRHARTWCRIEDACPLDLVRREAIKVRRSA